MKKLIQNLNPSYLDIGPGLPKIQSIDLMNELIFILTTRCNQHCDFCCEPPSDPDMKLDDAINWLKASKAAGIPWIDFSGGEPLLHKNIEIILKTSKELGLLNTLSTNGLLVLKHVDRIFSFIDQWNLSLHGSEKVHNRIVNRSHSYERILETCKVLAERGAIVHITYVVTNYNIEDVGNQLRILYEHGVSKICFNYIFRRGFGEEHIISSGFRQEEAIAYVKEKVREFPNVKLTIYHNTNLDGQCSLVRSSGEVWAVPMTNQYDYEKVFHINDIMNYSHAFPYIINHRKFTYPRLGPVFYSDKEFDMN